MLLSMLARRKKARSHQYSRRGCWLSANGYQSMAKLSTTVRHGYHRMIRQTETYGTHVKKQITTQIIRYKNRKNPIQLVLSTQLFSNGQPVYSNSQMLLPICIAVIIKSRCWATKAIIWMWVKHFSFLFVILE